MSETPPPPAAARQNVFDFSEEFGALAENHNKMEILSPIRRFVANSPTSVSYDISRHDRCIEVVCIAL